ncbi:hypothetical protein HF563_14835 [Acidithiobacillus ferridurans]|nr:hypothetical protein [Acidithiobacillus ferridurans]
MDQSRQIPNTVGLGGLIEDPDPFTRRRRMIDGQFDAANGIADVDEDRGLKWRRTGLRQVNLKRTCVDFSMDVLHTDSVFCGNLYFKVTVPELFEFLYRYRTALRRCT